MNRFAVDRRTRFFLGAAVACFLVLPVGVDEFRDVAAIVGAAYLVFALLSYLDHLGKHR